MKRIAVKLLAALVLAVLTVVAWQFRFENAGPPLSHPFLPGLPGWTWESGNGREANPDAAGVVSLTRVAGDPAISVDQSLGVLGDARFLHIEMDAKWTDVRESGEIRWATARVVVLGKRADGFVIWPRDHGLISAYGSRDWHHEESVFELPPDLGEVHLALQHFGESGTLQVRNLEVSIARQRDHFRIVTGFLVVCWIAWSAWWISPALKSRARWPRAIGAGMAVVSAAWVMVFPQPRFNARPLVGEFNLGPPIPNPPAQVAVAPPSGPETAPTGAVAPPPAPVPVPAAAHAPAATPAPATPPVEIATASDTPPATSRPPEKRESRFLDDGIRRLRDRFNFLHIAAFGAFGLVLFGLARPRVWPIAAVIAFASEALPNYQLHQDWDRGDIGDLIADGSGLLLAAAVIILIGRLWSGGAPASRGLWKKPHHASDPSSRTPEES